MAIAISGFITNPRQLTQTSQFQSSPPKSKNGAIRLQSFYESKNTTIRLENGKTRKRLTGHLFWKSMTRCGVKDTGMHKLASKLTTVGSMGSPSKTYKLGRLCALASGDSGIIRISFFVTTIKCRLIGFGELGVFLNSFWEIRVRDKQATE